MDVSGGEGFKFRADEKDAHGAGVAVLDERFQMIMADTLAERTKRESMEWRENFHFHSSLK